jgi:hypothetical protein
MEVTDYIGPLSLIPATVAILLAFITRNTVFSLAVACLAGVLVAGEGLLGFPNLLVGALGNEDFSWIFLLELFIGILIAFFQRTGAILNFSQFIENRKMTRKRVQLISWFMGMFVYFSDYFSPLFVGSTMRALSDRFNISREKLAYICDSTSAPVSILVPITGWAVLVAGLIIGMGPIEDAGDAMTAFIISIPFNIYSILAVVMVGLIASGILPDFGTHARCGRARHEGRQTGAGRCTASDGRRTHQHRPIPWHQDQPGLEFPVPGPAGDRLCAEQCVSHRQRQASGILPAGIGHSCDLSCACRGFHYSRLPTPAMAWHQRASCPP